MMSHNAHKSFVRQTRSMTKAAREAANLEIGVPLDDAAQPFEPSLIDIEGGDDLDCAGCDKPNNADIYMVQCTKCELFYHFSCANVTTATVHLKPFVCRMCVPRSVRSAGSHVSSTRSARIALELQQMDEQYKIEEEIAQEKLRLAQLERRKLYISKKYELLQQQDGDDEGRSVRSVRSSKSQPTPSRVENWVKSQLRAGSSSPGINKEMTDTDDQVQPLDESTAAKLNAKFTSTPLSSPNLSSDSPVQLPAEASVVPGQPASQTSEASPETHTDAAVSEKPDGSSEERVDPPPSVESILNLLQISLKKIPGTGTVPKTHRVPPPKFEAWRSDVHRNPLGAISEEDEQEANQRERNLLALMKQLEDQHSKERELQHQREEQLKLQLQKQEREQAEQRKQLKHQLQRQEAKQEELTRQLQQQEANQKQEMYRLLQQQEREQVKQKDELARWLQQQQQEQAKKESELVRLREAEQQLSSQLEAAKQKLNPVDGGTVPASDWFEDGMRGLMQSREQNQFSANDNKYVVSDGQQKQKQPQATAIDSPVGGLSSLLSSFRAPTIVTSDVPQVEPYRVNSLLNNSPLPFLGPTKQQIAARQVVSKELPVFTGDPADWPLFISSYNHSTLTCGYTDYENLLRLQRALKGIAKEAVSSLLLHPSTVPQVLSSLKLLYGRPEQIVHTMIARVRATPAPKAEKLDSLVTFGLVVQNLCGHLKAVGMEKHLSNPTLLHELVDKLPANVKFNWALYQQQIPEVDLNVFGEYMAQIASATSGVTMFAAAAPKVSKEDPRPRKEKAFVNTHSAAESGQRGDDVECREKSKDRSSSTIKVCPVCGNSGHLATRCTKFEKLCLDDRWKLVKEKKLCWSKKRS